MRHLLFVMTALSVLYHTLAGQLVPVKVEPVPVVPEPDCFVATRYRARTANDATPSGYRPARIYQQHSNAAGVTTRPAAPTMRPDCDPSGRCHRRTAHLPTKPPGVDFPMWCTVGLARASGSRSLLVGNTCRRALKTGHFVRVLADKTTFKRNVTKLLHALTPSLSRRTPCTTVVPARAGTISIRWQRSPCSGRDCHVATLPEITG